MDSRESVLVERVGQVLRQREWMLATAESCTGGLIGHLLTNVPGSSDWYVGGVVAYANRIKQDLLGVPEELLRVTGAVSRETVEAMARGVAESFAVQVGVAVSGIAGPTGGSPDKPVGTVWMAWSLDGVVTSRLHRFDGDRLAIKTASARAVLEGLVDL